MKMKLKRVLLHPEAIQRLLTANGVWRVLKGIPKDAKLRGFTTDPYTQTLYMFLEHDSFPEVDVQSVCPIIDLEITKVK